MNPFPCLVVLGILAVSAAVHAEGGAGEGSHWYAFRYPQGMHEIFISENFTLGGPAVLGQFSYDPANQFRSGDLTYLDSGAIKATTKIGDDQLAESILLTPGSARYILKGGCATCELTPDWTVVVALAGEVREWDLSVTIISENDVEVLGGDEIALYSPADFDGFVAHSSVQGPVARAAVDATLTLTGDARSVAAFVGKPIVEPIEMTREGPDGSVEACHCWDMQPGDLAGTHTFHLTDANAAMNDIFVLAANVTLPG